MAKPAQKPAKSVAVLNVVGPAKGRWRIGRQFTPATTTLVLADLTEDEVDRLRSDPELTVIDADAPVPDGEAAAPAEGEGA